MTKRMLIDAAHPEETRVVIVDGSRVDELDFESRHKRQLRGNVYLAKVTRVEPSLQAAFIDYGGNRHGFLAFSEIHPDYYQIPYEDKLALQQEEEETAAEADDDDEVEEDENLDPDADDTSDENDAEVADEQVKVASQRRKQMRRRRYKIQEVIKRGQILLVQAVKEERGNKGAAMTTYLSLAGRYCVLMPNTPRGGGISRKIPSGTDRKRLKTIMDSLSVPQGMGVIVRTAGAKRTKAEITRDYSYLSRLWDEIRDTTLKSVAPALIHEEGNLVKRSIRDLYNKDIEEVLVQGEEAYKTAKAFIKMLMPSHAKFVKKYDDMIPLFLRFDVERQIENSLDATVQLKSGGYLVIHPTEALVSVDVNSGRSTKERNVERTALKTNLEAAEELARQMRLRDLAGLIVVDFIDMDETKNNKAVERKMKDVLSGDRARIQTSRISQFGLMEISRQRRRRSLLEGSTAVCKHCDGVGRKRTVELAALAAIRAVEEFAIRGKAKKIRLKCPPDVALYLLNEKRDLLTKVDENADVFTVVEHDDTLIRPAFTLEVAEKRSDGRKDPLKDIEKELREESKRSEKNQAKPKPDPDEDDEEADVAEETAETREDDEDSKPRRRRGRRGGRNRKRRSSSDDSRSKDDPDDQDSQEEADSDAESGSDAKSDRDDADTEKPKRRRRRRSPARNSDNDLSDESDKDEKPDADANDSDETKPTARRRSSTRRKAPSKSGADRSDSTDSDAAEKTVAFDQGASDTDTSKPSRRRRAPAKGGTAKAGTPSKTDTTDEDAPKPKRRRKAPTKTPAKTSVKVEAEDEFDDKAETTQPKRRRAAPKRKAEISEETTEKPQPKRRAPAKSKAKPDTEQDDAKGNAKPVRRRKAPAKSTAKAPEKAPAKVDADASSDDKPKPRSRKVAPKKASTAKTASAPAEPKSERSAKSDDKDSANVKPARRRRAPARKPAVETAPVDRPSDPAPEPSPTPVAKDAASPARRRKAPPRRKRGLIDRLMGKE